MLTKVFINKKSGKQGVTFCPLIQFHWFQVNKKYRAIDTSVVQRWELTENGQGFFILALKTICVSNRHNL